MQNSKFRTCKHQFLLKIRNFWVPFYQGGGKKIYGETTLNYRKKILVERGGGFFGVYTHANFEILDLQLQLFVKKTQLSGPSLPGGGRKKKLYGDTTHKKEGGVYKT